MQVQYGQTEARSMLSMMNSFRTGSDAWYYDVSGNKVKLSGLGSLQYDYELEAAAMQRAAEIALSFSHTRPDGTTCFTVSDYTYGENIAAGYTTAASAFEGWQETNEDYSGQGHRRNMLGNYTTVGVGHVYYQGVHYWVQEFGYDQSGTAKTKANDSTTTVELSVDSSQLTIQDVTMSNTTFTCKGEALPTEVSVTAYMDTTVGWWGYPELTVPVTWSLQGTAAKYATLQEGKLTALDSTKTTLTATVLGQQYKVDITLVGHQAGKAVKENQTSSQYEAVTYCTQCGQELSRTTIKLVATPKLSSVANSATGVTVKWQASTGATKYRVYRRTASGSWGRIGDTTSTSFTDTKVESDTTYYYTVRSLASDGETPNSGYDTTGLKILCIAAHDLSSVTNSANGVTVQWQASKGVKKYGVFRRTASTGWERIETTDATSYTDTKAESGTTYYYTVRCLGSDGKVVGRYDTTGKKITHIAAPKLSSVSNGAKSVTIKWSASKGAKKYRVYRKTGSGGWGIIGETTSTSYTDTSATAGTTYTYTVRCITADGKSTTSGYDGTGKTIKRLTQPTPSVSKTSSGIKTSWSKISGANKYYVYRKTASGGWSKIATTTSTSYTDKTAKKGTTYYYTVKAASGSYVSSYTSSKAIKR
jgi:fibronectin type 3 domain-containing protein